MEEWKQGVISFLGISIWIFVFSGIIIYLYEKCQEFYQIVLGIIAYLFLTALIIYLI